MMGLAGLETERSVVQFLNEEIPARSKDTTRNCTQWVLVAIWRVRLGFYTPILGAQSGAHLLPSSTSRVGQRAYCKLQRPRLNHSGVGEGFLHSR